MNDSEKRKLKRIINQCSDAINMMDLFLYNEINDETAMYQIYRYLEGATHDFGTYVFDKEVQLDSSKVIDSDYDFDINTLSTSEKKELSRYINKYCCGKPEGHYSFERYENGYKAVIPYLLNRRAIKGIYFSPKKKYIANVFEQLLKNNEDIICRMSKVSVLIVCYSPLGEGVIRDNDNADSRDIINLINKYVMNTDDNGDCMNIMYDSQFSSEYKTEVYILPKLSISCLIKK